MICSLLEWKPAFAAGVPLWTSYIKGFRFSSNNSLACSCLGVYSHFPWSVVSLYLFMITARSMCTETMGQLLEELNHNSSFSLLHFLKPFFSISCDSLQEEEESWPLADWLTLGGVGCESGGRERGRAVKCYRNSWLKRGNGRYITSSIDTDQVGARLNCGAADWITATM